MTRTSSTRFVERVTPFLLGLLVVTGAIGFLVWDMFLEGPDPSPYPRRRDLTADSELGYVLLACLAVAVLVGLYRLLAARDQVVLEPDRVRFGWGARHELRREEVAAVEREHRHAVRLRLADPHDPEVLARAGVRHGRGYAWLSGATMRDGSALPRAVEEWFAAGHPGSVEHRLG